MYEKLLKITKFAFIALKKKKKNLRGIKPPRINNHTKTLKGIESHHSLGGGGVREWSSF